MSAFNTVVDAVNLRRPTHGTCVPRPKEREHAHCRSHPSVCVNALRDSLWYGPTDCARHIRVLLKPQGRRV